MGLERGPVQTHLRTFDTGPGGAEAHPAGPLPARSFKTLDTPAGWLSRHAWTLLRRARIDVGATVHWDAVAPLVVTSLAIMGSPGPTTISLVAAASAFGIRPAVPYLIGVIGGTTVVLVAVAAGITAVLLAVPGIGTVLLALSAGYILWLAHHIATAPPLAQPTATSAAPTLAGGALLGVANPKAWVAIAAVFGSSTLAEDATVDVVAKIIVLAGMIVIIHVAWLCAGLPLAPLLKNPRLSRVLNITLATALVAATALAVLG
jgi:threonine/homoserine/homoserine lactone efflux protein